MAPDEQAEFARLCGTTIRYLRKAISLRIRLGPLFCVGIERETRALVTRKHLRPDDWHLIWPELISARASSTRLHQRPMRPKPRMIPAAGSPGRLRRIGRVRRESSACSPTRVFSRQLLRAAPCHSNDEASVRAHQNRR
nr:MULTISPECIES: helix-turn-helix domain-containing protein [Ralstonia]